ncbi:putative ABC transporter ATP-binding protein [subsurface metagenome]
MAALFKLFKFLKNYTGFIFLSFLLLMVSVGLDLVQPKLIERAIDSGIQAESVRIVILVGAGILAAALVGSLFNLASGFMLIRSAQGMGYEMRNSLYQKLMSFSFANLDKWRTGELMVRMYSDVNTVRMFIRMGLLMIVRSIVMIAGSLIVMFMTNARLASIMAIFMPSALALFFVLASIIRPMFMKVRESLDELNNVLQENLAGSKVVRAFSRQSYELERFKDKNKNFYKASIKVGYTISIVFPLFMFVGNAAMLVTLWFGGTAVIENLLKPAAGALSLGQLIAFNSYALMAMFPIFMLGMVISFISMASASAVRLEELLGEKPAVEEKENAVSI